MTKVQDPAKQDEVAAPQEVKAEDVPKADEEDEEEEGETRCVCGEVDPPDDSGLYIQCEECSVWQHGFCVGITEGEDSAPDKYWCERCRPDLHHLYDTDLGEHRSAYQPVQQNKRQNRRLRREDVPSVESGVEDEEAVKSESSKTSLPAEAPKPRKRHQRRKDSASGLPTTIQGGRRDSNEDRRSLDRRRATSSAREEKQYQLMLEKALKESRRTSQHGDESDVPVLPDGIHGKHEADEEAVIETEASEPPKKRSKLNTPSGTPPTSSEDETRRRGKRGPQRKLKSRSNSRPSSNDNNCNGSDIGINKPIKPRIPTQRTSINEMRRRVSAILEFISRTQVELSQDQIEKQQLTEFVENEDFIKKVDSIYSNYDESLKMMDDLTRKLLLWEKKYALDQ
ncbi:Cti6p [Lachancea thermotolerans CBS 6340]|uniref:KLTH0H05126p n=1 Tax=Lachancea thermotolerans (strain ATCC 56472 / CBS 6340 / NRRL Y-8284) TaxID=559295 RepID=C5E2I1_LACTC|nr:KLTH0H05126p [Lachancea thermotolerans CBS 6340]CAR30242.1 KLTH0H05126p [Lachancea thermotolerans CBS 6340]